MLLTWIRVCVITVVCVDLTSCVQITAASAKHIKCENKSNLISLIVTDVIYGFMPICGCRIVDTMLY